MKILIIFTVLLSAVILGLLVYPEPREDFFILTARTYNLKGDSHSIRVFEDSNGLLNIQTVEPGSESTWENGWIDPDKPWFIYVDKINEVWLNHEDELAYIYSFEDRGGIHSVNLYPNAKFDEGRLINIIPETVLDRLSPSTISELNL
ncbi:MAG: hypothetical protein AAGA96_17005 [Verrucomicrobiota bacterium]